MKARWAAALTLLVVVGSLLAGCGGGSGSDSTGGSSGGGTTADGEASAGSFADVAESACVAANEQIAALGTPQQAEVLKYLESTEEVIAKLDQEVQGAAGDGEAESEYAAALGKSVPVLNEMSNAARNENFDAVRELSNELVELDLGELAEAAELKSCAEVPLEES